MSRNAAAKRFGVSIAVDLLRLILAYCFGDRGLRSTAAWATVMGLADISNVALLQRLPWCGDWLAHLVGEALAAAAPQASRCRLIRIIDATTVPKAGAAAKRGNKLVAHSQRLRSSRRTVRPFRTDRSAWGRDARSDSCRQRRDPHRRSRLSAAGPRSSTDSRTLPAGPAAWLRPPDPPGDLAPAAPRRVLTTKRWAAISVIALIAAVIGGRIAKVATGLHIGSKWSAYRRAGTLEASTISNWVITRLSRS